MKQNEKHCFCHIPYQLHKKGEKIYIKCGRSLDAMKQGQRGCTLFCLETDWPELWSHVQHLFPEGFDFETEWPECAHHLKARLSKSGYLNCRLGLLDPDVPCDWSQKVQKQVKKQVKKRKIE